MATELLIGFLTNNVFGASSYEQSLWEGACRAARDLNVRICTFAGDQISQNTSVYHGTFLYEIARKSDMDAFVINTATIAENLNLDGITKFVKPYMDRPVACIAREVPNAFYIGVDNMSGMKSMISHMITALGSKRIAYVSGPLSNPEAADRLKAYKLTLEEHHIPWDQNLVYEGTWVAPSGEKAVNQLIDKGIKFDALAAANDLMAIDAMNTLQKRGISIPNEVAVSGFDDITEATFCSPKLSTVAQPIAELGYEAVKVLVKKLRNESVSKQILVPAQLVIRGSAPQSRGTVSLDSSNASDSGKIPTTDNLEAIQSTLDSMISDSVNAQLLQGLPVRIMAILNGRETSIGNDLIKRIHIATSEQINVLETFCNGLRVAINQNINTTKILKTINNILYNIDIAINEHRITESFLKGKRSEELANRLVDINSKMNQLVSVDQLEAAIANNFPDCKIDSCHVVFFEDDKNPTSQVYCIADVISGKPLGSAHQKRLFDSAQIIPSGLKNEQSRDWVMRALSFEEQKIGYILMSNSHTEPFLFLPLANQIATLVHGLMLIARIEKAEALAAERTNRISELVRPMLATIEASGKLAREQSSTMANLAQTNTETSHRLVESERHVDELQGNLKKIVALTDTIDELSETINVIAINAAIAAARAGANGKVFGVISSEIRKLSIQTKSNTSEISTYIEQLNNNSSSFLDSNSQTRSTFSRLDSEIQNLLSSLENIQSSMTDLNNKAGLVLTTMSN